MAIFSENKRPTYWSLYPQGLIFTKKALRKELNILSSSLILHFGSALSSETFLRFFAMLNPSGLESHRERPIPLQLEYGDPRLREFTAPPPIAPPPPSHVRPSCIERMIVFFNDCCKTRKASFLLGIGGLLFNGLLLAIYIIYYDDIQRSICESEFGSSSEILAREPRSHQGRKHKKKQRQSSADRFRECEKYLVSNETETFEGPVQN